MGMSSAMITKAIDAGIQPSRASFMNYSNSNYSLLTINETPILLGRRVLARISLLLLGGKENTVVKVAQDELYMNRSVFIKMIKNFLEVQGQQAWENREKVRDLLATFIEKSPECIHFFVTARHRSFLQEEAQQIFKYLFALEAKRYCENRKKVELNLALAIMTNLPLTKDNGFWDQLGNEIKELNQKKPNFNLIKMLVSNFYDEETWRGEREFFLKTSWEKLGKKNDILYHWLIRHIHKMLPEKGIKEYEQLFHHHGMDNQPVSDSMKDVSLKNVAYAYAATISAIAYLDRYVSSSLSSVSQTSSVKSKSSVSHGSTLMASSHSVSLAETPLSSSSDSAQSSVSPGSGRWRVFTFNRKECALLPSATGQAVSGMSFLKT